MTDKPIEIKIENKEVIDRLLDLSKKGENLRPLMKNIAGILASATEENFKNEGRPNKWTDLADVTKKSREKIKKWPGQILQVEGQLASSVTTQYDDDSAVIGSNKEYAAIHQLGGQAGRNKKVTIPARPYLQLTDDDYKEILHETEKYFKD
ncbi:phage virion morphogenesis protein [bacterium]|nr:phage virion morphogenesis protein [bacterium]